MQVEVHEVGHSKSKIIVIDELLTYAREVVDAAAALPAFPAETRTGYPGKRYQIGPGDKASSCVMDIMRKAGPLIQSHYEADNFRVSEASFSMVTIPRPEMSKRQRIPHYDWDDPSYLAIMLHLHHVPDTGTAFYRHVASELELVSPETAPELRGFVQAELAEYCSDPIGAGGQPDGNYNKIFQVEARFNRLVIYQGCLLHSGYFPPDFDYSGDPWTGRLTANIFIQTAQSSG